MDSKNYKNQIKQNNPKPIKENLTTREIKDMMGSNRPTYGRHRGAVRQKN
ncbi:hypothetical protein [Bacillus suaedae]|uniref:Uncharacterized protein n=1 Tax=Halalkalibacter suaedae TaxID=2822140 RepID=A0A940WSU8_9BACI|nr:hypothetical protein [Bacillus suaedae]MBP3951143.1 hypothetical protein [Bacillus suaedae]